MTYFNKEKLRLFPIREDLIHYTRHCLVSDLAAGLAVALFSTPQSMADSLVAGVPPSMGVAAVIVSTLMIALFSSSRHLSAGPTNSIAILTATVLTQTLLLKYGDIPESEHVLLISSIAIELTLLVGILQLCAAFFKMGQLIRFIGRPVVVGYLIGVVINVFASQAVYFLGIPPQKGSFPLYAKISYLFSNLSQSHAPTTLIGIGCLIVAYTIHFVFKKPRYSALAILFFSGFTIYLSQYLPLIGWEIIDISSVKVVGDLGEINTLFPAFQVPSFNFELFQTLFPVACTIALFSALESCSVARAIAHRTGQEIAVNQEILALGIGNTVGAFFGAMACSGSTSRSTLNYAAGGKTRLAIVFSCFFIGVIILILSPFVAHIPLAGLATLLFFTMARMVNSKELRRCLMVTRSDAAVLAITIASAIFINLDAAFYLGFSVSIAFYLRQAAKPKMTAFGLRQNEAPYRYFLSNNTPAPDYNVFLLEVEGEVFFAAAEFLQTTLEKLAIMQDVKVIILNVQNARDLDLTTCQALEQAVEKLHSLNKNLIICGIRSYFYHVLKNFNFNTILGEKFLLRMDKSSPQRSKQSAMTLAWELIQQNGI